MTGTTTTTTTAATKRYDDLQRAIDAHRASVMEIVQRENVLLHEALGNAANTMAELEGRMVVAARLVNIAERDLGDVYAVRALTEMLTMGPRDTWSGRGNDVARAHHDGIRQEVARFMERLER